jgi:hypothetical protein
MHVPIVQSPSWERYKLWVLLLVAISVAQVFGFATAHERENWTDWKVIRHDYVEFCNGNTVEINLEDGSLHGSLGTCAPDLDKPPKQIEAQASQKDLVNLRAAIRAATSANDVSVTCAAVPGPRIFSGPISLTISRRKSQAKLETLSTCKSAGGRNVFQAFERAVAPLHRFGFRRWN